MRAVEVGVVVAESNRCRIGRQGEATIDEESFSAFEGTGWTLKAGYDYFFGQIRQVLQARDASGQC